MRQGPREDKRFVYECSNSHDRTILHINYMARYHFMGESTVLSLYTELLKFSEILGNFVFWQLGRRSSLNLFFTVLPSSDRN